MRRGIGGARLKQDLERISNPIAQQIVRAAFSKVQRLDENVAAFFMAEEPRGRGVLQCRLARSGLAQALAAGPGVLPDITRALPWPWNSWYTVFKPRGYRALTRHIADYLWWYLDPLRPVSMLRQYLTTLLTLASTAFIACWPSFLNSSKSTAASMWALLLFGGVSIAWAAVIARSDKATLERADQAVVLYFYLVNAYSDENFGSALDTHPHVASALLARREAALAPAQPLRPAAKRLPAQDLREAATGDAVGQRQTGRDRERP